MMDYYSEFLTWYVSYIASIFIVDLGYGVAINKFRITGLFLYPLKSENLCGASEGFVKALKVFIKLFEAPQCFLMSSGGIERDQWYEMGSSYFLYLQVLPDIKMFKSREPKKA